VPHDKRGELSNDFTDDGFVEDWGSEDLKAEALGAHAAAQASNVKALVKDGSGYYAALKVREDFGCVLFQPINSFKE
jgi:hypothetical protein